MGESGWCWTCWFPPPGPSTPFQGALVLPDTLRVVALALIVVGVAMTLLSMTVVDNFPQRMRFMCLVLFSVLVASIQVEHLGDTANWRLMLSFIAVLWQALSVGAFLRDRHRANRHPAGQQ